MSDPWRCAICGRLCLPIEARFAHLDEECRVRNMMCAPCMLITMGSAWMSKAVVVEVAVALGAYVLGINPRARLNRIFAGLAVVFAAWLVGFALSVAAPTKADAVLWFRLSAVGWTFGPVLVWHFLGELTGARALRTGPGLLVAAYGLAALFLLRQWTGTLFAAEMRRQAKGRWVDEAIVSMVLSSQAAAACLRRHGAGACTDVTGFGLLGHLVEMTRASGVDAVLTLGEVPLDGAIPPVKWSSPRRNLKWRPLRRTPGLSPQRRRPPPRRPLPAPPHRRRLQNRKRPASNRVSPFSLIGDPKNFRPKRSRNWIALPPSCATTGAPWPACMGTPIRSAKPARTSFCPWVGRMP